MNIYKWYDGVFTLALSVISIYALWERSLLIYGVTAVAAILVGVQRYLRISHSFQNCPLCEGKGKISKKAQVTIDRKGPDEEAH